MLKQLNRMYWKIWFPSHVMRTYFYIYDNCEIWKNWICVTVIIYILKKIDYLMPALGAKDAWRENQYFDKTIFLGIGKNCVIWNNQGHVTVRVDCFDSMRLSDAGCDSEGVESKSIQESASRTKHLDLSMLFQGPKVSSTYNTRKQIGYVEKLGICLFFCTPECN